jgi:hypothetical protein
VLDGDRLLITDPRAHQRGLLEWQRVHPEVEPQ